jgi:hypothetical protein
MRCLPWKCLATYVLLKASVDRIKFLVPAEHASASINQPLVCIQHTRTCYHYLNANLLHTLLHLTCAIYAVALLHPV